MRSLHLNVCVRARLSRGLRLAATRILLVFATCCEEVFRVLLFLYLFFFDDACAVVFARSTAGPEGARAKWRVSVEAATAASSE